LQSYVSVTAFSCYIENFKFQIDWRNSVVSVLFNLKIFSSCSVLV
jgi:hypothetical protein